jgi:hypothetical protein
MQALKELPSGYDLHATLDLAENRLAAIGVNVLGVGFLLLFGWLALSFSSAVRADIGYATLVTFAWLQRAGLLVAILIVVAIEFVMVLLHEAVHGAFFWIFTHQRPVFGLKLPYAAYAAAPDWFLPRNQHLAVGLGPFVLITVAGMMLLPIIPASAVLALLLIVVSNAAGAAGDFVMIVWLLRHPSESLVRDTGSAVSVYRSA